MLDETIFSNGAAVVLEHWKVAIAAVPLAILVALSGTYVVTSIHSFFDLHSTKEGREPPLKPYWIPFLGDLFPFLLRARSVILGAHRRFGTTTRAVTVRMGHSKAYVMLDPQTFATLLAESKNCTNKLAAVLMKKRTFGTPKSGLDVYLRDNSGTGITPLPGTNVPAHLRVWYHQSESSRRYLSGENLKQLTARILHNLSRELTKSDPRDPLGSEGWVAIPDFYAWWMRRLAVAFITANFGHHFLRLSPSFVEDFLVYLDERPAFSKLLPRWLARKGYRARERILDGFKRWYAFARQHSDYRANGPDEPAWDEYWGSSWNKVRHQWGLGTGEWDDNTLAAEDLSLLVASSANVLPMTFWNLAHIYNDKALFTRVRGLYQSCIGDGATVEPAPTPKSASGQYETSRRVGQAEKELPLGFNTRCLTDSPLLQSVYAEALRMHVSMFHNRSPALGDYRVGQFTLRKGAMVILPTTVASHDARAWGDARTAHGARPLDRFWAERFLVPQHEQEQDSHAGAGAPVGDVGGAGPDAQGAETMVFSTEGLEGGAWTPYGGGALACPGRRLAKELIIGTPAVFGAYFDLELLHGPPCMDDRFFGMGTQPPGEPVPVRIRRKVGAAGSPSGLHAGGRKRRGTRARNGWYVAWQE